MEETKRGDTVTLEQQVEMGLRKRMPERNWVPTEQPLAKAEQPTPPMPLNSEVVHTIDVVPSATQHVEVRTNSQDRAWGFVIETLPLCSGFAAVVLGICSLGFGVQLFGLPALVIVFTVFATGWTLAYLRYLGMSAEGVTLYEAQEKWGILRDEQRMRWRVYWYEKFGHMLGRWDDNVN